MEQTFAEVAVNILKKKAIEAATEIVSTAVFPALQKVVKDTATPIDDILLAALEAPLKAELLKQLEKLG